VVHFIRTKKVAGCVKVVCVNVISEVITVHHYLVCSVSCIPVDRLTKMGHSGKVRNNSATEQ
jgi:hypothetical protein